MSSCHHHHHHDRDRCREPRRHREEGMMSPSCPTSIPIHGRCVMTPRGPVCCMMLADRRMR
jgi:hypothetical protein